MSYTTLFKVPENGEIESYAKFGNAFQGAFNVWSEMARVHLDMEYLPLMRNSEMQRVWDLHQSNNILLNDRIVMASTFDRVMVKKENLLLVAAAMEDFGNRYKPGHLPAQAQKLRELAQDESCFAVCWCQTSVVGDAWEGQTDNVDDDDSYRMYDISKDDDHWFLFDELPLPSVESKEQDVQNS